jgi:LPXTG-motif cell wall-anchored protein
MSNSLLVIIAITLSGAAAFLFIWRRRDRGIVPEDALPDALHDMLERRPKS